MPYIKELNRYIDDETYKDFIADTVSNYCGVTYTVLPKEPVMREDDYFGIKVPYNYRVVGKMKGVYFITCDGEIVYIGSSDNCWARVKTHFDEIKNASNRSELKYRILQKWLIAGKKLGFKIYPLDNDFIDNDTLTTEVFLIQCYKPILNGYYNSTDYLRPTKEIYDFDKPYEWLLDNRYIDTNGDIVMIMKGQRKNWISQHLVPSDKEALQQFIELCADRGFDYPKFYCEQKEEKFNVWLNKKPNFNQ